MRQQMMRKHDGLRALKMGVPRKVRFTRLAGTREQYLLKVHHTSCNLSDGLLRPQPQVGCNLVIPAPSRVQTRTSISGDFSHSTFNRSVNIFITFTELKRSRNKLCSNIVEGGEDILDFWRRQHTCPTEATNMSLRPANVDLP
jgi:hypothetical protein